MAVERGVWLLKWTFGLSKKGVVLFSVEEKGAESIREGRPFFFVEERGLSRVSLRGEEKVLIFSV